MDEQKAKSKRTRSPAYPFISLPKALERAKVFYEVEKRHPAPFAVSVSHWDFKPKSSGGFQTVAALKQYGLMQDVGGGKDRKVQLTDPALRILLDQREESPDRNRAIKTAALKPKIHAEIWGKWGADLPSDGTLQTYLTLEKKFNDDSAGELIKIYKDTIRFAKLDESDKISGGDEDIEDTETEPGGRQMRTEEQIFTKRTKPPFPPQLGETERFRVPLKGGRVARLLFTGALPTQSDIDKLIALLELSKDSFPKAESEGHNGLE